MNKKQDTIKLLPIPCAIKENFYLLQREIIQNYFTYIMMKYAV